MNRVSVTQQSPIFCSHTFQKFFHAVANPLLWMFTLTGGIWFGTGVDSISLLDSHDPSPPWETHSLPSVPLSLAMISSSHGQLVRTTNRNLRDGTDHLFIRRSTFDAYPIPVLGPTWGICRAHVVKQLYQVSIREIRVKGTGESQLDGTKWVLGFTSSRD